MVSYGRIRYQRAVGLISAQRQVFSVLSHFGICSSYTTVTGSEGRGPKSGDDKNQDASIADAVHQNPRGTQASRDTGLIDEDEDSEDEDDSDDEDYEYESDIESGDESGDEKDDDDEVEEGSLSYSTGMAENMLDKPSRRRHPGGLLERLSQACLAAARHAAMNGLVGHVYDNINFLLKIAEQILGRKDNQQNGTCATVYQLFGATAEDMKTSDLIDSMQSASPLQFEDFLLTEDETQALKTRLKHTVLRIIVTFGGEAFEKFQEAVMDLTPVTEEKIPLHKTEIFPLAAMNIDESSTAGNAEVVDNILQQLNVDREKETLVKILTGDQLSISRLRSLAIIRAGHEPLNHSYLFAGYSPGFFHYQMAITAGTLETHWGDNSSWVHDPGSLHFHNKVLDRKPIVLTSMPPYRTCRDLIFVSLYARVFHCLEKVNPYDNLDEYAKHASIEDLQEHASQIVDQFADPAVVVHKLREERRKEADVHNNSSATDNPDDESEFKPTTGDDVFTNAILFMRDALVLREFNDAIKDGDSGRIVTVLKFLAFAFRGNKHPRYAHETLHLLHNLVCVWPDGLKKIIMNNWLANPTGLAHAWVPIDLLQEHMNFWIKRIYKAHGSNASWEWLAKVSPCINILRRLATHINQDIGSRQGSKHHAPDLTVDICVLKESLHVDAPDGLLNAEVTHPTMGVLQEEDTTQG
ncbi:hypothetical protein EUX98_g9728, partial [Antrodiella citrinella]